VNAEGPLLICYDGSDGARAALAAAARSFGGSEAAVVCFWEPFAASRKRFAVDILELVQDSDSINAREEELATRIAEEGAALAVSEGLDAHAHTLRIDVPIDEAILTHADEIDARAIVLGARGRSSLRSLLLGDIAHEVVQRASRPVFVVPSPRLADRRRDELARETVGTD
jgi:nucleotide-binding universal stress UspA family protein